MEFNRKRLEEFTTSVAVTLLFWLVIVLTLVTANYAFAWDLFPPAIEMGGLVIVISSVVTIISSVIINIMLNIGRIADSAEKNVK